MFENAKAVVKKSKKIIMKFFCPNLHLCMEEGAKLLTIIGDCTCLVQCCSPNKVVDKGHLFQNDPKGHVQIKSQIHDFDSSTYILQKADKKTQIGLKY